MRCSRYYIRDSSATCRGLHIIAYDLPIVILTYKFFILFSPPVLLRREKERVVGWALSPFYLVSREMLPYYKTTFIYLFIEIV